MLSSGFEGGAGIHRADTVREAQVAVAALQAFAQGEGRPVMNAGLAYTVKHIQLLTLLGLLVGMIDCAPRWGRKESFFLAKLIVTVHEVGTFPRNVRAGEVGTAPRAVHDLDAADCGRVVDASLPDDAE